MDASAWATRLLEAECSRVPIAPVTASCPEASLEEGYAIQSETMSQRRAAEIQIVGAKVGLHATDGVPVFGLLTAAMLVDAGEPVTADRLIRPRLVPHLAFLLGRSFPPAEIGTTDVLRSIEAVAGAVEVVDSRFGGDQLVAIDQAADNAGAARVVLNPAWVSSRRWGDLDLIGCLVECAGEVVASGAGAAALGHPALAAVRLGAHLARQGHHLDPGSILLTGGLTAPIEPRDSAVVTFARLGAIHLQLDRTSGG